MTDDSIPRKHCYTCGEQFPSTPEYFRRHSRHLDGLQGTCKTCARQYDRVRYATSPKARETIRRFVQANPEKVRRYRRQWLKNNSDKQREMIRQWRDNNPDKVRVQKQRRFARERNVSHTFTAEQWHQCLKYFHGCCAYCECQQSFDHVIEQDHYIPLASGGHYVATNIVPACKTCNVSKNDNVAEQWIKARFNRKAKTIIIRVEAYFAWAKEQNEP